MTSARTQRAFDRSLVEGPIGPAVWKLAWPTMLQNIIAGRRGDAVANGSTSATAISQAAAVEAATTVAPMSGRKCPECGAYATIRKDGCDYCTHCGHIGACG